MIWIWLYADGMRKFYYCCHNFICASNIPDSLSKINLQFSDHAHTVVTKWLQLFPLVFSEQVAGFNMIMSEQLLIKFMFNGITSASNFPLAYLIFPNSADTSFQIPAFIYIWFHKHYLSIKSFLNWAFSSTSIKWRDLIDGKFSNWVALIFRTVNQFSIQTSVFVLELSRLRFPLPYPFK